LVSILAKIYLTYIFVSKVVVMSQHGDTTIRNFYTPVDFDKEGPYNYEKANILIYFKLFCANFQKCGGSEYWNLSDEEL
jgi:hypothetical protein